jgi:hypothetical protein
MLIKSLSALLSSVLVSSAAVSVSLLPPKSLHISYLLTLFAPHACFLAAIAVVCVSAACTPCIPPQLASYLAAFSVNLRKM